jgi:putative hydrolase of the HAD superfamily
LFDFGGTLDSDGVAWKERVFALYRAEGLEISAEAFAPHFYAADDPLVGTLPADADLGFTVQRLVANLEAGLPGGPDAARGARVAARFLEDCAAAFARNRPVLQVLAGRYRLGIVSNFYGNLGGVCRGADLHAPFGAIADSEVVGASKPDPAIFQAALQPLGVEPHEAVMVGDSLHRDLEGAARCGAGFVWIAPDHAPAAPGHPVIRRLDQLLELLA